MWLPSCCSCSFRVPQWCEPLPFLGVLLLIAWLYGICALLVLPRVMAKPIEPVFSQFHILGFHACFSLLVFSLYQCVTCKELYWKGEQKSKSRTHKKSTNVNQPRRPVETKYNGKKRFCSKCQLDKPDRAHHCNTCKSCVLKMDHHCVYLNQCIGFHNYKAFLLFLFWGAITCIYESYLIFYYLLEVHLSWMLYKFYAGRLTLLDPSLQISLGFLMSLCVGIALYLFLLLHIVLASFNFTTLEFCEKRRTPQYINYYNISFQHNLQEIFGNYTEFPYWLWPVVTESSLRSQGRYFKLNKRFIDEKKNL